MRDVRALIVDTGNGRGALEAARALGSDGWFVGLACPLPDPIVGASRHVRARHDVPWPSLGLDEFSSAARRAVVAGRYDLVFGCGDDLATALADVRDVLPTAVAHADAEAMRRSVDKYELASLAERAGLETPRTVLADRRSLAEWSGPVVVKARSHSVTTADPRRRFEAATFPDPDAARTAVADIEAAGGQAVLQPPVHGQLEALSGVFVGGRFVTRLQQRATRTWPVPNGVSARAVSIVPDEPRWDGLRELLSTIGWSGLVEAQFLVTPRGDTYLIDLNGRVYGSLALARASGVDHTVVWAHAALGSPPQQRTDARPGVRFSWLEGDLRRAFEERRGGLHHDVNESLRWFRTSTDAVWDRTDWRPATRTFSILVTRVAARLTNSSG